MQFSKLIFATLTFSLLSFAADPFIGTWKMNPARTTSEPPMPKIQSIVMRIEPADEGLIFNEEVTDASGKTTKATFPHIFDGNEHPHASKNADTVVATRTDSHHVAVVFKKNGSIVGRGTWEVSPDGSTLTSTVDGRTVKGNTIKRVVIYEWQ